MDAVYLALIRSEGDDSLGEFLPFALLIGGAGLAAVAGSVRRDARLRSALLWPAAVVLIGIGLLAIFSIGLPLLVAGVLSGVGGARASARAAGERL